MSGVVIIWVCAIFLLLLTAIPDKPPCVPDFVEVGVTHGWIDEQRYKITDIDKKSCWVQVQREEVVEKQWVDGSTLRFDSEEPG